MTIAFDADTGSLQLSRAAFERLISWTSGETDDVLQEAGLVANDALHPAIAAGVRAVIEAVCRMNIRLVDENGTKTGDGWIARHGTTLLLDGPHPAREFITLPAALLPAAVARLVQLQPRPTVTDEPLHLSRDDYDNLLAEKTARRQGAALSHGPAPESWRAWKVTMSWRNRRGEGETATLEVVDTRACWCLCTTTSQGVTMTPTNATEIWRRLTLLLPDEAAPV